jgi:hypothetical protein
MLWLGGAVANPMTVTSFGNQTDIPATVLNQLDIDSEGFYFSNDLLNPKRADFSMFIYNQGFGFVTPGGYAVYDMETNSFSSAQGDTTGVSRRSMGLFQNMIDDFSAL